MNDHPSRPSSLVKDMRVTRREITRGVGFSVVGWAVAGRPASADHLSSPEASPAASPVGAPSPPALPETSLNIVRNQQPEYPDEPRSGANLRMYVRKTNLAEFSPTAQMQDIQISTSLYDPLVWIGEATMEPRPWLAESWTWSDDGLILTFRIREDVTFHDGSPFTAEDVRFSMEAYRDDYDSAMAGIYALVVDVAVDDDTTVHVTFAEPDGAFLYNGASQPMFSSSQYRPHWESRPVGERTLSTFPRDGQPPLGTGPWKLRDIRDDGIILDRNDTYWQGPPHFDRLHLLGEDNQQHRIAGWKKGDVDILSPLRSTEMDEIWNEEGKLFVAEAPVVFFAAFNFANPANATQDMMEDSALRQALTLAVDRRRYAREVFHDFIDENAAGTVTQPWAHNYDISNPAQDIERANQLLDEAGWIDTNRDGMRQHPGGNKLDLYCIVNQQERPELLSLLERLKDDFGRIGARLTVQEIEPEEFDTRWRENRMYDMVAYSLVQYPAFMEFDLYGTAWDIRTNRRGWNPGGYSNAVVDEAIEEYFMSWTQEDMKTALDKLQRTTNEDLFGLWFGFPHDLVLVKPDIQGFAPHKYFQTWNTRLMWRGEPVQETAESSSSPSASPVPGPSASPIASPESTPMASPVPSTG